ncbi:hypothetical protein TTHERM_00444120 (macronuclear) [Tetrahymena thermophila SB210]|uniref:Uncharacterized protein n=1 Tax=Tetrahymena thermophila (strain SB210) TaxID=312017 RepID=I7M9Y1_TETTS|nr:hypothetical protein TTHERM_00444120 [Tetrahymena thermophila SB210]EAS03029.2 hypothetical protein TTHERM_00444120 [Tetrahymena thermophila SB210]|eukprot:XP_001023274.2 hypothetical protein TTHERM_00444120 [Tetrahymena thermophila SB210]
MDQYYQSNNQNILEQYLEESQENELQQGYYKKDYYYNKQLEDKQIKENISLYHKEMNMIKSTEKFKKMTYSTHQSADEVIKLKQKKQIMYSQNELKTQIVYQQIANDILKNQKTHQDLPQFFQAIIEYLKFLYQRTKGQNLSVSKILEFKTETLRIKQHFKEDRKIERKYILQFENLDFNGISCQREADQIKNNSGNGPQEKVEKFKQIYDQLSDVEKEKLVDQLIKNNECFQSEGSDEKDKVLQKLMLLELNRGFYNDQYITKVCYFCDSLNRVFQGYYNFIEILQIDDDSTPLVLHPIVVGIKLYFDELLQEPKGNDENKKIYSKPSSLPQVIFINMDGFDNPLNLEAVKNFPTFNYFSIFHEFFNPDGIFSFYKYIKQRKEVLKSFFPFFTPFYKHVQEYYNEKAKSKKYTTEYAEQKQNEKLDSLYRGVISDEEFAFLFEEYIMYRLNEYSKVDALVFSYTCVMSPENKRTEQIFRLSEETFFNIFTHIARRTNFRMIFLPRLIIRNLSSKDQLPQKIIFPYQLANQKQQKEMDVQLEQHTTLFKKAQEELKMYEQQIRDVFGIFTFYEQLNGKVQYENENFELVKYIQNINCGFFQFFNSLNILKQKTNSSIFTQKKNILHWRFVQSTVYMQNRIQEIKNKDSSRNNGLGVVKKEFSYFIKYLKEKENLAIQNLSDQESLDFQRQFLRSLELVDSIFLFQHNDKFDKRSLSNFIKSEEISAKKFRIINTLNKSCFLNKYSQYYVDYKNQMVYFFNILFPADQSIPKQYDDLVFTMTNCVGQIPKKDSLEDEIQVQKICDWKFSRITLGLQDGMQKHRQYFLQNATIVKTTKKNTLSGDKRKYKFLLFFGGEINYYDKNKKEINLQSENFIKNTCLYCLKISQESYAAAETIYSFEEIKIFGINEEFIQNLSYSSGISMTYLEQKEQEQQIQLEEDKQKDQNKQPQDQGGIDKQNKQQQQNKVKEPSDKIEDYLMQSYLFIFGGEYNSKTEQCTLQNVILYSNIDEVLNKIIDKMLEERNNFEFQTTINQITNDFRKTDFQKIKYLELNEERILRENTQLLEEIDLILKIQQKDYIKKVQIYLLEINQILDSILQQKISDELNVNHKLSNLQTAKYTFEELIQIYYDTNKLNQEELLLIYSKALCHKILGQNQVAHSLFCVNDLINQLCLYNQKNTVYYLSNLAVTGNLKFYDTTLDNTLERISKKCWESLKLDKENKDFLIQELLSNQCRYLYQQQQAKSLEILEIYSKILENYLQKKYFSNQYVGNKNTIHKKLAEAYQILYKCQKSDSKQQIFYYEQSLNYFESLRTIPQQCRQNVAYVITMMQIPKQQLVHLDSIKSINKRKAFKIKPTDGSQYKQKLDTRVLLIGGTCSKYQNYSDSNKVENAHFFYPVLYLNYLKNQKQSLYQSQVLQKVDIKPENGFIQRIDLNQQFSPHQIASLNHNYIIQSTHVQDLELEVVETKKNQGPQAQANLEVAKTEQGKVEPKKFKLDQIQLEIRILESYVMDTKNYFYNKKDDDIFDETQKIFQFQQTYASINEQKKDINKSGNQQLKDGLNTSVSQTNLSEQQLIAQLQQMPPVYGNQEDKIDIKEKVDQGSKLNKCQIQEHQQNQAQYIQKIQNNIYTSQDQRLYGCFYTSLSFIFETIFIKQANKDLYQNRREKPKTKSYFWEIMKQLNKIANNQAEKETQSTLKSLEYEQKHTQIIFLQKQAKCLLQSGLNSFSTWCLYNQTAHQNETDIYLNIFWRKGSNKLIMYDHENQKIIQVQMMVHNKKLNKALVPNENQIRYVFFNNKDKHVYICIEEEFQYKFQNVLMRAPLQNIQYQYSKIIFEEQINKHDPLYPLLNKITFTINSKDKIFGIVQENQQKYELYALTDSSQKKWTLQYSSPLDPKVIIKSFEGIKDCQISHLEIISNFSVQNQLEFLQFPLQLAILNKQIDIDEIKKIKEHKQLFRHLEEKIRNVNQDQNDQEKAQFQYISTVTKRDNKMLNQAVIKFLCNPSVFSLIKQSFNSLVLGHSLEIESIYQFSQLDYRIQFLDISKITNINDVWQEFIEFFLKKGHYLKYLNISGQKQLLTRMIYMDINFSQLLYIDISNTSLLDKNQLIGYIQNLLNSCINLLGINIYQMKLEDNPKKNLIKFKDLQEQTFTSTFLNDYFLNVYIEKELSEEFQQNDDNLLKVLENQFGQNHYFIDQEKRQYQKLNVKSKSNFELAFQSDRIDKIIQNNTAFQDPIVFSTETKYLIFERRNTLNEEKKYFIMKFYSILQSDQKIILENIQRNESINIQFNTRVFKELIILNVSKLLNDEGEKFTIFGILIDNSEKAYICKMILPVPTGSEIPQDKIKLYKSRSNIKKYSKQWLEDCFLPIYHNKKVKNTFLCVKDSYQVEGYSFFSADEIINF